MVGRFHILRTAISIFRLIAMKAILADDAHRRRPAELDPFHSIHLAELEPHDVWT